MVLINSQTAECEALLAAAKMMAMTARTAPKARGLDSIQTLIVEGDDIERLAAAMDEKMVTAGNPKMPFSRDANSVRKCKAVLLVGVTGDPKNPANPLDCGACGYSGCADFMATEKYEGRDFRGPLCIYQLLDLGIALGSAVSEASAFGIDNRIMFTIGAAARSAGFLDCDVVMGVPMSVSGKNPFFDR